MEIRTPSGLAKNVKKWQIYALNGYTAFAFLAYTEEEESDGMTAEKIADIIEVYVKREDEMLLEQTIFQTGEKI